MIPGMSSVICWTFLPSPQQMQRTSKAFAAGMAGRSNISPMTFQGSSHARRSGMRSALELDANVAGTRPERGRCRKGDAEAGAGDTGQVRPVLREGEEEWNSEEQRICEREICR